MSKSKLVSDHSLPVWSKEKELRKEIEFVGIINTSDDSEERRNVVFFEQSAIV